MILRHTVTLGKIKLNQVNSLYLKQPQIFWDKEKAFLQKAWLGYSKMPFSSDSERGNADHYLR